MFTELHLAHRHQEYTRHRLRLRVGLAASIGRSVVVAVVSGGYVLGAIEHAAARQGARTTQSFLEDTNRSELCPLFQKNARKRRKMVVIPCSV
jgi:hypothetical protein